MNPTDYQKPPEISEINFHWEQGNPAPHPLEVFYDFHQWQIVNDRRQGSGIDSCKSSESILGEVSGILCVM